MEQIGPMPGAPGNVEDGTALGDRRPQRAIGRQGTFNLGVANRQPQTEQEDAPEPEHAKPSQYTMAEGHKRSPFPRAKSHTILVLYA